MFQYRQVLVRLRLGDSDRVIARSGLMGRPKVAMFRLLAQGQGWLAVATPLPDDAEIAALIAAPRRARSTISTVEPHRSLVERWADQGVGGKAIHAALWREHGYRGITQSPDRWGPRGTDRYSLLCTRCWMQGQQRA
jgi:hypothetical protein